MEREQRALRVLIYASSKGQYREKAWDCPEAVIDHALQLLQKSDLDVPLDPANPAVPLFLVKERMQARTWVVFDIFHDNYKPDTAHVDFDEIPVIGVYLCSKESVSFLHSGMSKVVNAKVREIHDDTGLGSRPPFSVDRTDGKVPCYYNPRIPLK